jgi:hypothetical protein
MLARLVKWAPLTHEDCRMRVCLIGVSKRQTVRPISRPLQPLIDQLYLSGLGHTNLIQIMSWGRICARWCILNACVHLMWQLEQWPGYRPCYKNVYPVTLIYFLRTHISLVFCILTINHMSCSVCVMCQFLLDYEHDDCLPTAHNSFKGGVGWH